MSSPGLVDQPVAPVRRRSVGEIVFAVLGCLAIAHVIARLIGFAARAIMHAIHPHHHGHHGLHHKLAGASGHPAVAHAHHLAHHHHGHHLLVALIVSLVLAAIFFAISALLRRRRERAEAGGVAPGRAGGGGLLARLRGRRGPVGRNRGR